MALLLPAAVTLEHAPALLAQLGAAVEAAGPGPLVIDAAAVTEFDTSALALLLEARRQGAAHGFVCELRSPPPKLLELAALYGVEAMLGAPVVG